LSDLALFLVRTGFLVVMWIFVFTIISVIRADLFGQRVVSKVAEANAPRVVSAPIARVAPTIGGSASQTATGAVPQTTQVLEDKTEPTHLVVTEGPRAGFSLKLAGTEVLIGRAKNSDLVVDDEFASTQHAKLIKLEDEWLLQDLNSTNGTFINGTKLGTAEILRVNTPVKIGKTVFELRA